jgi:hypothetical protein
MITLQNILDYVEITNKSFELRGAATYVSCLGDFDEYLSETDYHVSIGFEFKKDVWYWFRAMAYEPEHLKMDVRVDFRERYNRQNGASQKSFRKGWQCENEIIQSLEAVNLFFNPNNKIMTNSKKVTSAAKSTSTPKKSTKASTGKKSIQKPGVIAYIVDCLVKSGEKGITKDQILARLTKKFPDRDPEKMKKTVQVQVGSRINKEKFPVQRLEGGKYRKA